ncbi:hypothetical protein D3C79_671750 [compost metagenome]
MQRVHPTPAFQHHAVDIFLGIIVISRVVDLEEALCAAFLADQGPIALCKTGRRQDQVGFIHDGGALVIGHDQVADLGQCGIHFGCRGVTIEIVLHHDGGISRTTFQLHQCLVQRATANHRQTHAVGSGGNEGDANIGTATFQRLGNVGRSFNDSCATRIAAGDDQGFLRTGQGLYDHVNFLVQVFGQIGHRRC